MSVEPFLIDVPQTELDDTRARLRATRWPQSLPDPSWSMGTEPAYLRRLVERWTNGFDWRAVERRLNRLPQFRAAVDGLRVHFARTGTRGALPLLLLHGWPGSFVQMERLIPLLADGFDVIAASLPGFGFSDPPTAPGMGEAGLADLFDDLMTRTLGLDRYAVHGSDFGAGVASQLAARHPEHLVGVHISGTTPRAADPMPEDATEDELRFADDVRRWRETEVGYGAIQSTKPQTLAVALADSPAGTAGWIVEKLRSWSDCDGRIERRFSLDDVLTVVGMYWYTGAIGTSIRLYRDSDDDPDLRDGTVPIAYLLSDRDMLHTPREWVARSSRIDRFTQVDRGGHFLEWEEPEIVAADLREFLLAEG